MDCEVRSWETALQALQGQEALPQSDEKPFDGAENRVRESLDFDAIVRTICRSGHRKEAIRQLVDGLAKLSPGTQVRLAIGGQTPKRIYDSRLGWVGKESSLYRDAISVWSETASSPELSEEETLPLANSALVPSAKGPAMTSEKEAMPLAPSMRWIRLPDANSSGTAILSFGGNVGKGKLEDSLRVHEEALAALIWSRPKIALPWSSAIHRRLRPLIIAAAAILVVAAFFPIPYRTHCTVTVEPTAARTISAPFEATLESVLVEPGDQVKQGQQLLQLDGRPIRLELQSIEAEILAASKQQDVARATGKIAEGQLAGLKVTQLERRRDLLASRLERLTLTSPIDGVVVSGDLRRAIGSPMELGKALLEVAPLERVRMEIEIPEYEIRYARPGDKVQLKIESSRSPSVHATIQNIYPAAQIRNDDSVFVAPLDIDNDQQHFRPGMKGRATVFGPSRPWAWCYMRSIVEQFEWILGV